MIESPEASLLRWIPLLPLASAIFHGVALGVARRPMSRTTTLCASLGALGGAFVMTIVSFALLLSRPEGAGPFVDDTYTWIGSRDFSVEAAFLFDPLAALGCFLVTGLGGFAASWAVGTQSVDPRDDRGFQRFFAYFDAFIASMLVLVLADNLLFAFVGWEGAAIFGALLTGFWYADDARADAMGRLVAIDRIGGAAYLFGTFLLFWALFDAAAAVGYDGPVSVATIDLQTTLPLLREARVEVPPGLARLSAGLDPMLGGAEWRLTSLIALCFVVAAATRSGLVPFGVRHATAMQAPSAAAGWVHAAMMTIAGVWLLCRLNFLFAVAPGASATLAWLGAFSAISFAALASVQRDLLRIVAHGVAAQAGMIFVAFGCGAYTTAVFQLVALSFTVPLLAFSARSVVDALDGERRLSRMGGLREGLPWAHWSFLSGAAALSGLPPLTGFWSRSELFVGIEQSAVPGQGALFTVVLLASGLAAFAWFRATMRVFWGRARRGREVSRSPDQWRILPLVVLGVLSIFGGLLGPSEAFVPIADANSLRNFLAPVFVGAAEPIAPDLERALAFAGAAIASFGIAVAAWLGSAGAPLLRRLRAKTPTLQRAIETGLQRDGLVGIEIAAPIQRFVSRVVRQRVEASGIERGAIDGGARALRELVEAGTRRLQSGLAHAQLVSLLAAVVALVGWLVWGAPWR